MIAEKSANQHRGECYGASSQNQITIPTDSTGQYYNNAECEWTITLPDSSSVRIQSNVIDLQTL